MKRATILLLTIITFTLAGCGGGGGSSTPAVAAKTTVVLRIGTQGAFPAGVTGLSGVGVTITLPPGVTVATDGSGNPEANVAMVSGVASGGSIAPPVYTAPTATTNGKLDLVVAAVTPALFNTGEFVTVTCKLPASNTLQASDFPVSILSNFKPANQLLQPVSGLTPAITATLY